MRVVCIDDKNQNGSKHRYLKYGGVYETSGDAFNADGEECYIIPIFLPSFSRSGKPNLLPIYRKSRFVPLSDIDEKEMERQWMLTPVELPNQVN